MIFNYLTKIYHYKLYEMTRYSFRREQSGELVGLEADYVRLQCLIVMHSVQRYASQAIEEFRKLDLIYPVMSFMQELGIK